MTDARTVALADEGSESQPRGRVSVQEGEGGRTEKRKGKGRHRQDIAATMVKAICGLKVVKSLGENSGLEKAKQGQGGKSRVMDLWSDRSRTDKAHARAL